MPTERADKDPSPPDGSAKRNGGETGPGGSGIKAKLAARFRRRPDDSEKKKQLQDYTAWVNNYLKRKPGIPLVTDLRTNLQDGVSFVNLVEIVARAEIDGVDRYPTTSVSRRTNIERATNFLQQDGVTLHGDACKDIYEGNSKGIMRVILAIAERYQPRSVKPRSVSDPKPYTLAQQQQHHFQQLQREHMYRDRMNSSQSRNHPPVTRALSPDRLQQTFRQTNLTSSAFAANSFSVPNMASLNVHASSSSSNNSHHRSVEQSLSGPTYSPGYGPPHTGHVALSQPDRSPYQDRNHYQSDPPHSYSLSQDDVENDTYSTPVDQLPPNAGTRIIAPKKKLGVQLRLRSGPNNIRSIPEEREMSELGAPGTSGGVAGGGGGEEVVQEGAEVVQEVGAVLAGFNEFKTELLQLHALLLRNSDGSETNLIKELVEGEVAATPTKEATVEALAAAVPAALTINQKDKELVDKEREISLLRDQLSQQQDECTQIESECATLRNMVDERNAFITTMKSEIYRKEYKNDTQRVDLHHQILQKDTIIKQLEGELTSCKDDLDEQIREVETSKTQLSIREQAEQDLRDEIESLKSEVSRLAASEESCQTKLATKERKIEFLEERLGEVQVGKSQKLDAITAEADAIRESMTVLRSSLSPQDSGQQTLDVLEKNISDIMAKLIERSASPSGKKSRRHRDSDDHHRERDRERRKRHKEKHSSYGTGGGGGGAGEPKTDGPPLLSPSGDMAKVFYYMISEKQETPYVTLVPRKSHGVTLRDFKSVFDRHGSFRFFFKTEDPDCGVVKEEIIRDDQVLPSWHGKIMVWISEKTHHHR